MRIFYTTKRIFWSNEGQDYLESTQFNEFFSNQWVELPSVKSINWTSHYEASFYATDAFEATYFKIEKNNQTYYFFVQDIKNDSANGKFWYLTLDLYNTYGKDFIEQMKVLNPKVSFKRKHANRFFKSNNAERRFCFDFNKQRYLLTPPSSLDKIVRDVNTYPPKSYNLNFLNSGTIQTFQVYGNNPPYKKYNLTFEPTDVKYFEYVILKRPGSVPLNIIGPVDFVYLLIGQPTGDDYKPPYRVFGTIDYDPHRGYSNVKFTGANVNNIDHIPSDLIVGKIKTSIPPSMFTQYGYWRDMYGGIANRLMAEVVLLSRDFKFVALHTSYEFISLPDTEEYLTYHHEPIFAFYPFNKMKLNGGDELSPLCFFKKNNGRNGSYIVSNNSAWVVSASASIFVRPPKGALEHEHMVKYFFEATYKKPIYGDILNNYLLNNANAVSTGIQNKIGSAFLSGIGGLINVGGSLSSGNTSGALQSGVGIAQSVWGVAQTFRNHQARLADLGNKVDDLKDVYGKGATVEDDQCMVVSKYELPVHIKQLVFKDIYFNGYEFNGADNFNTYRNRTKFNYFEITDANQFLNLYTNYPKQIINDLSEKFMNGIRLWRTTAVNFDMSLDNREISFD